ncbi:serine hydrolase domain-containing protein [Zavarzinia sp. CC-PAN008]|uniref:serine hydrolase domain-containing protein n=1 Tax=Zavarzinia sp. CC-PAN008 TaxID=3243332 RepID=UPI003F74552F
MTGQAGTGARATEGYCDSRFRAVREVFEQSFASGQEVGAGVAIALDGRLVVDLWGGSRDAARTKPWMRDTLVNVFSTTKGIVALCANRLIEEGRLDPDWPVTRVWPEYGQKGKEATPVRYLMSHRAGQPAWRADVTNQGLADPIRLAELLAEEEPWFEPGSAHAYHAVSYGTLVGELIRRVTGQTVGQYFRDTFGGPLDLDFWIGLPDREHGRVADLIAAPPPGPDDFNLIAELMKDPTGFAARAFFNPPAVADTFNQDYIRRAEIAGGNGHGTARSLARLYNGIASHGLLKKDTLAQAIQIQDESPDGTLLGLPTRFGLGFMRPTEGLAFGPSANAFGHPGMGGALGFGDPDTGLGFGYVMCQMQGGALLDPRAGALIDAAYAAL